MLVSFGATSPVSGGNCPASGSWETWCDCMWPQGHELNAKCKAKPYAFATPAPWTVVGAQARGIPHASGAPDVAALVAGGGGAGAAMAPAAGGGGGLLGNLPRTIAIAGGGVLLLGVAALALSRRRKPAMSGYRRRHR